MIPCQLISYRLLFIYSPVNCLRNAITTYFKFSAGLLLYFLLVVLFISYKFLQVLEFRKVKIDLGAWARKRNAVLNR